MPELPEVEFAARSLDRWARGRTVVAIACYDRRALDGGAPRAPAGLVGLRLKTVERIGKNLLLTFADGRRRLGVWSHLGMTGKWVRRPPARPAPVTTKATAATALSKAPPTAPRFARLRLQFSGAGGVLYFVDPRLFGFFRLVADANFAGQPVLAALGPDPLRDGIDVGRLTTRLARTRLPIKPAIMDQALIPGVGNIQAAEGLHRAAIDPRRAASSLTPQELKRLARALLASFRFTLKTFPSANATRARAENGDADVAYVEEPGTPNPFKVYDRAGERCPRCRRGTITRIVQAGRATYFCPLCQR